MCVCVCVCENMSDEVAPLRLDQQILAETREVKKRQRARRSGLKPGPGRPDFTENWWYKAN